MDLFAPHEPLSVTRMNRLIQEIESKTLLGERVERSAHGQRPALARSPIFQYPNFPFNVTIRADKKFNVSAGPVHIMGRGFWWYAGEDDLGPITSAGWIVWRTSTIDPNAGGVVFQSTDPNLVQVTHFLCALSKVTALGAAGADGYKGIQCQFSGILFGATI